MLNNFLLKNYELHRKSDFYLGFLLFYLLTAFATRLFSVLRFESVIHEFDPYFNYRTTRYLTEQGFYNFHNWFDDRAWYPLGRIIGGTIYPGTHLSFLFQVFKLTAQYPLFTRISKKKSFL